MDIVFSGVSLVLTILVVYVVLPILKSRMGKDEISFVKEIVTDIVASLEGEELTGGQKKKLAMAIIKEILKLKKIHLPDIFISSLIESSLYFLRKKFKEPPPKKKKGVIATYSVRNGMLN